MSANFYINLLLWLLSKASSNYEISSPKCNKIQDCRRASNYHRHQANNEKSCYFFPLINELPYENTCIK